jgi:hypothetical protein
VDPERGHSIMTDDAAEEARLMKVTEAAIVELDRQGVAEAMADLGRASRDFAP